MTQKAIMASPAIQVRVDPDVRAKAEENLDAMLGMGLNTAIKILVKRLANDPEASLDLLRPSKRTQRALQDLEEGRGQRFSQLVDFMNDLHANH
ncbi:type II toxin-antitoxin system RelB/DinJ family antitoxin [Dyella solisilvae]|nr:type II toxin-antitoxin system RelB/DinJ family antitoxin [Dyella solisilvae]